MSDTPTTYPVPPNALWTLLEQFVHGTVDGDEADEQDEQEATQ